VLALDGVPMLTGNQIAPDWAYVHHELRRPGVTLMLLWEEYRQREPDGYRYSRWSELYRAWESRLSPTMRRAHPAGERMFVDYADQTIDLTDGRTGEIRPVQIFVAVMGASNYTYAEATLTQSLPDWIGAHVRALAFTGGVPAQLVPDNPRSGSIAPTGTSLASTAPISIWQPITVLPSCRRALASRAAKPRSRSPCWWSSVGSWRGCGTAASSRLES
jgi:transposase